MEKEKSWRDIMTDMAGVADSAETEEVIAEDQGNDPTVEQVVVDTPIESNEEEVVETDDSSDSEIISEEEVVENEESEQGDENSLIDDWDSDDSEVIVDSENTGVDLSNVGKAIGLDGEFSSESDLINAVKEKISSYEQKINDISGNLIPENIPDNLKEAVKVASEGGDYESYLNVSSVDYDSFRDEDLVANSISHHFKGEDGKIDEESLFKYMDEMSDTHLSIEAEKIRNSLKINSESQKKSILEEARNKKEKVFNNVKNAISSIDEIAGFKVMPHQKEIVKKAFKDDKVIIDMFYSGGEFDGSKAVEAYLKVKYFDKITSVLKSKVKNSVKKEILDTVTNPEINRPSHQPQVEVAKKDSLSSYIDSLKTK